MNQYYEQVSVYLEGNPTLVGIDHPEQILQFLQSIGKQIS